MQFGGVLGPIQDYLSSNVHETDGDSFLKLSNYEDTVRKLDMYYGLGNYTSILVNLCLSSFI